MNAVMLYGAVPVVEREKLLASLPFAPQFVTVSAEHYGGHWGSRIDWSHKINAARRRNVVAAMECTALVVIGRPKFSTAIARVFKLRGRRVFWWHNRKLTEVDTPEVVSRGLHAMCGAGQGTPEWELWAEQAKAKQEKADAYTPFDYNALRETVRSRMRPTHWATITPSLYWQARRNFRWAMFSISCREEVDALIPQRNWNERCDDLDCSEDDVLHPSHQ